MACLWVTFSASLHFSVFSCLSMGCRYLCDNPEKGKMSLVSLLYSRAKTALSQNTSSGDCYFVGWKGIFLTGWPLLPPGSKGKVWNAAPHSLWVQGDLLRAFPSKREQRVWGLWGAAQWTLRTSLGKEMSHPVSQPHHPAFILGIVPHHCSWVCHPLPLPRICGLSLAQADLAEKGSRG